MEAMAKARRMTRRRKEKKTKHEKNKEEGDSSERLGELKCKACACMILCDGHQNHLPSLASSAASDELLF